MNLLKNIWLYRSIPVIFGITFLMSTISTCERFPELILEITTDSVMALPGREYKAIGTIASFSSEPITQHGFCISTSGNPTTKDLKSNQGAKDKKGQFESYFNDLNANSNYYLRAYAVTDELTEYGQIISFTTPPAEVPTLTTASISDVTNSTAVSGGTITDYGGAEIIDRGVCWSSLSNPSISDSVLKSDDTESTFESTIIGLQCNTKYYVRAYAKNSVGVGYGDTISFVTTECLSNLPDISTSKVTAITSNTAKVGGTILDEGTSSVNQRGVCWSLESNPTLSDSHTFDGIGQGIFSRTITGLDPSTTYFVRAYAINSEGTAFGNEETFTTLNESTETVTDYNGNVYQTVQIGDQIWMQENLKVTHYADGTPIPLIESKSEWDALGTTAKAYCWYDNSTSNRDTYGGLYSWATVMNGANSSIFNPSGVQGVCPDGWHLPSDDEWKQLEIHLGMNQSEADAEEWRGTDEGGKLKETGTTHWASPNTGATNESGFTARPGGYRYVTGIFGKITSNGDWWTSSENSTTESWFRGVYYEYNEVSRGVNSKEAGFSVRCVKGIGYSVPTISTIEATNITVSSANTGGNISDDGGTSITARGVCWSTSENPTLSDEFTSDGPGLGNFTSSITGLECSTTYYVRAYTTNSVGTAYGAQVSFTTSQCPVVNLPIVTTTYLSNTTTNYSEGGGDVTDDGGGTITARGVCWSSSPNPTILDNATADGTGLGSFTSHLNGLTKSNTYFVRAYATNSAGSSYGDEIILRTYEGTVTDFDGNQYWTVLIGSQIWIAENLKVTYYADGTKLPLMEDTDNWDNLGPNDKAYCWYNNSVANGDDYGALYTWAAAINGSTGSSTIPSGIQGVCPIDWHIPSDEEWKQLEMELGMSQVEADNTSSRGDQGGALKETGNAHWDSPNYNATNSSGFTARAAGLRKHDGTFLGQRQYSNFWTASDPEAQTAWIHGLSTNSSWIVRLEYTKVYGFSVRCIKND